MARSVILPAAIVAFACAQAPAAHLSVAVASPAEPESSKPQQTSVEVPKTKGPAPDPLKIGDGAPSFAMKTANPETSKLKLFSISKFVGASAEEPKSALVLTFGASYCEPCKRELSQLGGIEPKLSKAGVMLAVVVIDTEPDGIEAMRKLTVDDLKLPYPVLSDRFGVVARRYRANPLPYMVVIDKSGVVQWVHSGFTENTLNELTAKLGL